MDIAELIKDARHGRVAAQKCLFDLYASKMEIVCRRYIRSAEDAEEVLQDGFYQFFRSIGSFQYINEPALYHWLKKIMIRECLYFLHKANSFTIVPENEAVDIPLAEEALDKLSATAIFELIVQLPVGYRTVFNLYAVEGIGHKEIGRLLGISEGTSKSQYCRAKVLLQKMLVLKDTTYAIYKQGYGK